VFLSIPVTQMPGTLLSLAQSNPMAVCRPPGATPDPVILHLRFVHRRQKRFTLMADAPRITVEELTGFAAWGPFRGHEKFGDLLPECTHSA
jgi:hypothetical protein